MTFNKIQQKLTLSIRNTSFILLALASMAMNDLSAATILVSEVGDAGNNCTLRQAIDWINNPAIQPSGCNSTGSGFGTDDQIDFSVPTVTLSNGQLEIDKDITINGGINGVTIEANGSSRILHLDESGTTITLKNLTLSGGNASEGAAIYMINTDLFLNNSLISGNHASSLGGAIYAELFSHVTLLEQSEISNNSAQNGGAIYAKSRSTINLTESAITNNDAGFSSNNGKGGGIYLDLAYLFIENSTITNNSAGLDGGGIVAFNNSEIKFTNSTLSSNKALAGAGISMLSNVEVTFFNSTIAFNEARQTPTSNGGGGTGGGIDIYSSTVTLNNSTVSNNFADYSGGAIQVNGGTLLLNNSTLSDNINRSFNGGLHVVDGSTVTLKNSIVANSAQQDCTTSGNPSTVTADDHNIIKFDDCNTQALNLDPNLGPLVFNGGLTKTHGLYDESQAVDNADDAICADVATINNLDQRGIIRPEGQHCDIGSFEGTISKPDSFYVIPGNNGKTVILNL